MKLNHNQNGFGAIEVLLIIIALGIIGFTGLFVYYSRQTTTDTLNDSNTANQTGTEQPVGTISYVKTAEPAGWSAEHQQNSTMYSLTNATLGCYVSAQIFQITASTKPSVATLSALSTKTRTASLASGKKITLYGPYASKEYQVSEGYIIASKFYVDTTVACKDSANYPAAIAALVSLRLE